MGYGTFNVLHLLQYNRGLIAQSTMLALYPQETSTTLTTFAASFKTIHG